MYKRITKTDRIIIETLYNRHYPISYIAKEIGKSRSSVYEEIKKGLYQHTVDWREETDWFDENRMMYIIKGINDDEVCNMVKDYIITSWYDACGECLLNGSESNHLMFSDDEWKFLPVEEDVDCEYELITIDELLAKYMVWRENANRRQTKKQILDTRVREIEISLMIAQNILHGDIEPSICGDLFASHYYHETRRLQNENAKLQKQLMNQKNVLRNCIINCKS